MFSYLLGILFFRKEAFQISNHLNRLYHRNKQLLSTDVYHNVLDSFFQILRLGFKSRGYSLRVISDLFFKFIWTIKVQSQDSRWTLRLIFLFNLRLEGLLYMEYDFSSLLEQKYHAASVQLRKYSESKFKENSKSALEVLGSIHYSAMKNLKACQT